MKFVGKTIAGAAVNMASGAADIIVDSVGLVAKNATKSALDVGNIVGDNRTEKRKQRTQNAEEKLVKLKSLFDSGILNQQEYETKKASIIDEF